MANRKKTITLGIAVAVAVLAIFVPILMALPLFVVAALLIAWATAITSSGHWLN
jgi:hypothetical protein